MSEENAKQLIFLFESLLHGDNQPEITQQIQSLLDNFNSIFDLFLIVKECNVSVIRASAIIQMQHIITKFDIQRDEQFEFIKSTVLSLLQNETDDQNKFLLGNVAIEILKKYLNAWPEFFHYALGYLENMQLLGFKFWIPIVDITPEVELLQYFESLMNCVVNGLNNESSEIRIYSIQLFEMLTSKVDPDVFKLYEKLPELVLQRLSIAIEKQNDEEATEYFNIVAVMLQNNFDIFVPYSSDFIKLGFDLVVSNASQKLKKASSLLLSILPAINPDEVAEQLSIYLNAVLKLAVEVGHFDISTADFNFLLDFIDSVGENTQEQSQLIQLLLNFSLTGIKKNDGIMLQIAILGITAAMDYAQEEIMENDKLIIDLIKESLKQQDSYLFDSCCSFLLNASNIMPEIYIESFNEIANIMFTKLSEPRALQTLNAILYNANQPPAQYQQFVLAFVSLLNSCSPEEYEIVVSCIASSIRNVDEINNNLYTEMRTILIQLLDSDPDTKGKVIECFGYLAKIAPNAIQEDLNEIMNILYNSISEDNDVINENIGTCIQSIVKILSVSIKPVIGHFIPIFIKLLQKSVEYSALEEDENDDDEKPQEYQIAMNTVLMQCSILKTFATLISELPQEMISYVEPFIEIVCNYLDNPEEQFQTAAATSILYMTEGLKTLSYDASSLFKKLIDKLYECSNIEFANELFISLGSIFISYAASFNEEQIHTSISFITDCLSGKVKSIVSGKVIDSKVLYSLFFCIRMFVISIGENIANFTNNFIKIFKPQLNSRKNLIKAYIIHTLGLISIFTPTNDTIVNLVKNQGFKLLQQKNDNIKNITLSALNFLVHSRSNAFSQSNIELLKHHVDTIIGSKTNGNFESDMLVETSSTLWCSIYTAYQPNVSDEELNIVLSTLPPVVDDDDIPFAAKFVYIALQNKPEAIQPHLNRILVNIFASGEWCLKIVPHEIMVELGKYVRKIPEEELQSLVKWNQHQLLQIQENLSKYVPKL